MHPLSLVRVTPAVPAPAVPAPTIPGGPATGQMLWNGFTWKRAPAPAPRIGSQLAAVAGR
jgi:hypothetical protein